MFTIRPYNTRDRDGVKKIVLDLVKYYPGIKDWLEKKELNKLDSKKDFCLVVEAEDGIVGCSISSMTRFPDKNDAVKLKTFYLIDDYQGAAIGNPLLEATIDHWAKEKAKKIYVTMSGEEFPELRRYLHKYGFVFCGVSPALYRDGSKECFMNKEMRYGKVASREILGFVLANLFENYGFGMEKISETMFVATKQDFIGIPERSFVAFLEKTDAEFIDEVVKSAARSNCGFSFVISPQPTTVEVREKYANVVSFIDFLNLETLFYPLVLQRENDAGFMQPIQTQYSSQLFYNPEQTALAVPSKTKLRSDKVYYGSAKSANRITRGQTMVIYESEPTSAIIGEGRVNLVEIGTPIDLFDKYGKHGVLTFKELQDRADANGELMAIFFSRTIKYPNQVKPSDLGLSLPQSTVFLNDAQLTKIREKGGYFA